MYLVGKPHSPGVRYMRKRITELNDFLPRQQLTDPQNCRTKPIDPDRCRALLLVRESSSGWYPLPTSTSVAMRPADSPSASALAYNFD